MEDQECGTRTIPELKSVHISMDTKNAYIYIYTCIIYYIYIKNIRIHASVILCGA